MSKVKLSLALAVLASGCSPLRHYELASYGPGDTSAGDVTHASDQGARVVTPKQKVSSNAAGGMPLTSGYPETTPIPQTDEVSSQAKRGTTPKSAPCDDSLWRRVYNPDRLQVHQMCVTVTGTIVDATHGRRKDGVRREADGDCHGWLKLDPGQEEYLNAGNMSDEEGNLVYEVVCLYKVTQKDAVSACKGYKNKVKLAPIGSHVRMSCSWVQDDNHAKWNECHPVSSIEVIP